MPKRYSKDLRDRAVHLVRKHRDDYAHRVGSDRVDREESWDRVGGDATEMAAPGGGDAGARPGAGSEERAEVRRLKPETRS